MDCTACLALAAMAERHLITRKPLTQMASTTEKVSEDFEGKIGGLCVDFDAKSAATTVAFGDVR